MPNLLNKSVIPKGQGEVEKKEMQSIAVIGSGLEEVASSRLDGCLFRSAAFQKDPRLAGLVNTSLAEFNDLPPNLTRLLEVLKDDLADARTVAKVVELNPALAAKVLKLVNSSFSGLRGTVSNLKRAVVLLGINHIRSLLLGTSVFMRPRTHQLPPNLPLGDLWRHSVAVSQIAGAIGDTLGNIDSATLISGGLLHDTGMLVLASIHPDKFAECVTTAISEGQDLVELELYSIGITHPLLSATLGKMWNLPQRLTDLMMYQSHPDRATDKRMITVLRLAEFTARGYNMGADGCRSNQSILNEAVAVLGVPPERASRLIDNTQMDEVIKNIHILSTWE